MSARTDYDRFKEFAISHACDAIRDASQDMPSCAEASLQSALRWMRLAAESKDAERAVAVAPVEREAA